MKSPLDGSDLTKVRDHIFGDAAHGYLIANISVVKAGFEGQIQSLQTREMKLDTLGVFPLAKDSLPLIAKTLILDGKSLTVPELFQKSQIPIFADSTASLVFIPPEGANICRYFYELWKLEDSQISDTDAVLSGFAILASYAGL